MDQLPRLGKRELICLLLFTCNYVVSVWRGFLFLWVLGMGYVILLWHSLSLPYNYFVWIYAFLEFFNGPTSYTSRIFPRSLGINTIMIMSRVTSHAHNAPRNISPSAILHLYKANVPISFLSFFESYHMCIENCFGRKILQVCFQ